MTNDTTYIPCLLLLLPCPFVRVGPRAVLCSAMKAPRVVGRVFSTNTIAVAIDFIIEMIGSFDCNPTPVKRNSL